MPGKQDIPFDVVHQLPELDSMLIQLLRSLKEGDWQKRTVASRWNVKDVVAHLLDGNIRTLSMLRDNHWGENANVSSYEALVQFLNQLNADWVKAMQRVSPQMLLLLHEITGPMYCSYYASLNPFAPAGFAVAWAGEETSFNWMHIAREYTEKFLHQQQIRDAIGDETLLGSPYYHTFMDILMRGLPHSYRNTTAAEGTCIQVNINDVGSWYVQRMNDHWQLVSTTPTVPSASISVPRDLAWKLFSKSIRPSAVLSQISTNGPEELIQPALHMVSVMA